MYRGTTPTYTFTLPDTVDLTQADEVYVTFSKMNDDIIMTKTAEGLTVTAHTVEVYLSQEETLAFPNGKIQMQINWIYEQGGLRKRACSVKMQINAERNLIDEVL